VHDLGQHLGCYGISTVQSPNCDALAADGVRFARSFTVAPQCSPSRAAMFTGRYPHENGMLGLAHEPHGWDLYQDERHLVSHLGTAGYRTALIGFQHETHRPHEMGYEQCDYRWHDSCENISRDAAAYITSRQHESAPFYLQVGLIEPHRRFDMYGGVPDRSRGVWIPPYLEEEPGARDDFAAFQGAIRKMDAAFGAIAKAVGGSRRAEDTLLIFTTDHGIPFPRAKCSLYDPGLETALIARWPGGGWTGGRTVDGLVSNVDLFPTLLEIAGADLATAEQGKPQRGRSFANLDPQREVVFGEKTYHDYYDPMRCVRTRTHKLIANFSTAPYIQDPSQAWRPLTTPRPKGSANGTHPYFELYNLGEDPDELENTANDPASRSVFEELARAMGQWMVSTDDALLTHAPLNPQHAYVRGELLHTLGERD
jgi:N-sulfoglucosamine sulfohydrolase